MDTAMTSNWHQPIQSLGSTKGDNVPFKHLMRVYFSTAATTIPINLQKDVRYEYTTEDNALPLKDPVALAVLLAEHSASIPDGISISYRPTSRWNFREMGLQDPAKLHLQQGAGALMGLSLSIRGVLGKRKAGPAGCGASDSALSSPRSHASSSMDTLSTCHSPVVALASSMVPDWVEACMAKAMFSACRTHFSYECFSQCRCAHFWLFDIMTHID